MPPSINHNHGFTSLILLTVAFLLIVTAWVVTRTTNESWKQADVRDQKRIAQLTLIAAALDSFYDQKGYYPHMTEPFEGWERSECSSNECLTVPSPFMEYLESFLDPSSGIDRDPLHESINSQYASRWGFLYRSTEYDDYQSYCLVTHLENETAQSKIMDDVCDNILLEDDEETPKTAWWYAIGNSRN